MSVNIGYETITDAKNTFNNHGLVLVEAVYDQEGLGGALDYVRNAADIGTLQIADQPSDVVLDLNHLEHSQARNRLQSVLGSIIASGSSLHIDLVPSKDSELAVHQLSKEGIVGFTSKNSHAAKAVTSLDGKVYLWPSSGWDVLHINPGDVAFVDSQKFFIEPVIGKTATALVLDGKIQQD